jgi:hypothetical protein
MYFDDDDYLSGTLIGNGGTMCTYDGSIDASTTSFVWLDCISRYSATFSYYGTGSVSYGTPAFEGNFLCSVEELSGDAEVILLYTADVWGC